ncbi:ABC transporter ATP-binding protein [Brevibacillus choshinensis]|uniref:ABC transporter ATP-binding protein n=1 Tax=Brevibacillus choshinensis TaxID=54911 RepID=A0ABX7FJ09_BRECH|nr:ABC transporter ATP-binding protein [Brevibacillus choshinensis]QRG65609.1 ABC transporter ATP-binding protein [Brevibacillus choshinensis]
MNQTPLAPMGVGKLLDRSFEVYRQHFGAFFLMTLMLFGPFLLLQDILIFDLGSMSFFVQDTDGSDFWESMASRFAAEEAVATDQIGFLLLYLLVVLPLMSFGAYPQLLSGVILLTKAAIEGKELGIRDALKQSFRRFWPLVGATIVYGLVIIGIVLGFMLVCALFFFLFTLVSGATLDSLFEGDSGVGPIVFAIFFVIAYVLFLLVIMVVPGFFMLRWGFYLPYTLLEGDGVAIGKSWRLTQGNFWRLFGLYLVLIVLYSVLSGGLQAVITASMGVSVISQLILLVASCLLTPWMLIVYSLAYFDLRVRKEGTDLFSMLHQQMDKEQAIAPEPAQSPETSHE